ncbi:MAG: hypothetical protein US83_C0004G0034 [Candidatus Falkowbacteria bacterium GW2011_GWC2_38_22]|uniref:Uncharacterized protein n=1 Tax=Candidatus Falkowbacteria bacterium GW2011_GWE1_38_31 TaxID=1618638 RepID=A0A0G0JT16_9BACT|nr:MAG: hypothetical protein US73_C0002G0083 [Candidatus Falkowbacteria bacterium GW2011_GWF2_38_1205]KKQ61650.1 MAG: hypothetical protein US83_C0004G0034 [Candidatus Falkowbacteria bacterium GW2011_GWC2_38_22]KKQ63735.1 MAG: hypothetical protein US84_C0004G0083 [Candidatus Falkowbacteria bacterium GW2011_GWF1_38_22]KKQ65849.1 MAG: hypothetical protein US87_C0004G0034 [Candidatus Falkowbacteria bacterium GW2011_GWE2_38_254]KKQ70598.1 MAG: hypothetical protein US91_C0004G0083 [Candidatus Falkowb
MSEKLDLDELFRLAKDDPDAFEKKRQELIDEVISSAPPRKAK